MVDPPRKGLDEQTRDAILKMKPPRVVYVSCDPATLARDVRELTGAGYQLMRAQAFDLFSENGTCGDGCLTLYVRNRPRKNMGVFCRDDKI